MYSTVVPPLLKNYTAADGIFKSKEIYFQIRFEKKRAEESI